MGCSCNIKADQNDKEIVVSIDKDKLMEGDMYNITLLSFASNPIQFEEKLNKLGLKFEDNPYEDIEALVRLNELGWDKEGKLTDDNDNPINFDLKSFVKEIEIDESENNPIKIDLV